MKHEAGFTDAAGFRRVVASTVSSGVAASFGRMHLVSIRPADAGENWERLLPKAAAIAENILRHRLASDDSCLTLGPGRYLLLFPGLDEAEGAVKAAAVAQEIRNRLVGDAHQAVDIQTSILPLSSLDTAAPGEDPIEGMQKALASAPPPAGAIALSVEYQPVWEAHAGGVVANRARIRRDFAGQTMYEAAVMLGGENDPLAVAVNDAMAAAAAAWPDGFGPLFLPLQINVHSLALPGGLDALARRLAGSRGIRGRVVVELSGTVADIGRPQLRAVTDAIHAIGAEIAVRVVPERATAAFLRDCGVRYLCLNHAKAKLAGFTDSAVYALFTVVAREIEDLGFELCIWNTATPQDVKRGAALGYGRFSGAPIGPTAPLPTRPRPLAADRVFA
ncbi:hypothetical protein [Magnetospirillum sp. UT-4]|uniref:hypothetical protein n=1 Tax=Magnetospirillum sp. UT-4 TaxID=2681467 RepID=UPI0013823EA8|nr:hypothetical protein [Magnetospirillum sp. UT-4]CAA7626423.1 conserved hypothetical protein [Magnetospirillum sp. UT-4]